MLLKGSASFCRFPECRSGRVCDRNHCGSFAVERAEEDVTGYARVLMTRMHAVEGFTPLQENINKVHTLHDELMLREEKLQLPIPGGSKDDWGSDSKDPCILNSNRVSICCRCLVPTKEAFSCCTCCVRTAPHHPPLGDTF
jgi:hypothetical protein